MQEQCSHLLTVLTFTPMMALMTETPRDRARVRTLRDIVRIGRTHLAVHGAANLSLRAVARDLGVVSSAVYRYVESRDELLTLLVVDGYDELGDAVDAALAGIEPTDFRERFITVGRAVRAWALREPATYALLFGTPVAGYSAPAEQTTGPGTRVIVAMVGIWEEAWIAGKITLDGSLTVSGPLTRDVAGIREEFALQAPDELVARGVVAWAALFGGVSFELFGQYGPDTFTDPEALYEHHLAVLAQAVGFSAVGLSP